MNLGIGATALFYGDPKKKATRDAACQTSPVEIVDPSISRPDTPVLIPAVPFESITLIEESPVRDIPEDCCSKFTHAHAHDLDIWKVIHRMDASASSCTIVTDTDGDYIGSHDWLTIVSAVLTARQTLTPIVCEQGDSSVGRVIRRLRRGVRYVTIVGDRKVFVVSQATVLRFVLSQSKRQDEWIPFVQNLKRTSLHGIGPDAIHTIHDSCSARQAYEQMTHREITSMPIVDDRGRCNGVISVSDARILGSRAAADQLLALPVHEFVQRSRGHLSPSTTAIVARREDTLWDTVIRMLDLGIHHIYIVNSAGTPVGVVSYGDVLRFCF